MSTTTDLSKFGMREIQELRKLFTTWCDSGLPKDFIHDEVHPMMNMNSGNVFLTNSEYQVAMITDENKLESFYSCPICGHEGFLDDLAHNSDDQECQEFVRDTKEHAST